MNILAPGAGLRSKIRDELRRFLIVAAYLFVCFAALAFLKSAILQAQGIVFHPLGFAAVKALICAKFIALGDALHLGGHHKGRALIWPTLRRTVATWLLVMALNLLEQLMEGYIQGRSAAATIQAFGGGTVMQLIATSIVMLLILVPLFILRSLDDVLGSGSLSRIFFRKPGPQPLPG